MLKRSFQWLSFSQAKPTPQAFWTRNHRKLLLPRTLGAGIEVVHQKGLRPILRPV